MQKINTITIGLPILSCGKQLKNKTEIDVFQEDMLKAYNTLEAKLLYSNKVDFNEIRCYSCMYNLNSTELYNNLLRIKGERKNEFNRY